jgi:hypothetical protein
MAELVWTTIDTPDGELGMEVSREHTHALSFRFLNDGDGAVDVIAHVKWDGCINWSTGEACMYHFCGPDDVLQLGRAFLRAWLYTRDNLDVADKSQFISGEF